MIEFLSRLFDTSDFPARWQCGNWTAAHGWLHILSDLGVWSAYIAIPCVLGHFVLRRKDIPFRIIFLLFGAFILACGTTHLMEVLMFWWPAYRLAGVVKLFTAVVSWGTVLALVPVAPKVLAMRSPEELEREIAARKETENALQKANAELETRVRERTAELAAANALLQYEREMLRITLASIGDAVMVTDLGGKVTFLNSVAQKLTGWKGEEAEGQSLDTVFRIVNEKTRKSVENPALRALREGIIVGLANHTTLIARDGIERAIDDSAAPVRHENGDVAGAVLVFRDVTEHRMAERSVRSLAAIVESSDDAIIGKDMNGIITSWNRAAERIFGYTSAEAVGQSIAMLAPADRVDEMPAILSRVKQGERVEHFDTVRRAKDGRLVPISLTVSPIRDQDGEIVGASKIARDVSERKQVEEAVHQEKERLHATLTGIGDAVIVTNAQGFVTLMNPVAQSLTGWKEEANGRLLEDVFNIINEQTRQKVENPVSQVIRTGTVVGLANHTALVAKDGTERPIEDSAAPIRGKNGEVVGVVLVFRDATDQRQVHEAMRKNAEVFKLVHQIGKVGYWEWNSLTDENTWSPEIEALYGLAPGTFEGSYQRWAKLVHPDDLPRAEEDVRQAMETGKYSSEFRVIWPDGSIHWLEARANVFKDGHDRPVRIMGVNMDITERRQNEEALRASEERWRTMAEALPNLVWTDLPNGQCDWLSSQWGRYTGIPENDLLGLRWLDTVIHPDDRQRTLACWQAACADEADYDLEYRIRRYDGDYHWFKTRGVPMRNELGKIIYWFGTCTDIEDTKRVGERLRLLWEAAALILASTEPDVMLRELFANIGPHFGLDTYLNYLVDETGDALRLVSFIGIEAERAKEISRLEFGKAICGTVALERRPIVATHIQQSEDPKVQLIKAFGIRAYACYPLEINHELLGTLSFASRTRDGFDQDEQEFLRTISHYVAVAYERMRLVGQLKDADRRKDEFLAILAHELRNPLAPIRNSLELLSRSGVDSSSLEQARSVMERQIDQMVRLIDDLLDVTRISQGKAQVRKETIELASVTRSAVETTRPFIEAQAHELTITVPSKAVYFDADPTRLAQVIANLLDNAAKYTEKGGHIWLTAERQDTAVTISVRDTGIGIAAENLPHIFEMFSQAAPALERSQGGLGIGLALVRGLVELHGGKVEARSEGIGKGSEFVVRLPMPDIPIQQEPVEPADSGNLPSVRKCSILVVDDLRDTADTLVKLLVMMGHEAHTAYDGLEALQAAATYRPDVVLLDVGLPKMNGYEVARHIRQQPWGPGMALIAVTGWGQEEDKRRAVDAGFDHHMTKPVSPAALENLLALISPVTQGIPEPI
jgi:PAS domain S-box-containing protein